MGLLSSLRFRKRLPGIPRAGGALQGSASWRLDGTGRAAPPRQPSGQSGGVNPPHADVPWPAADLAQSLRCAPAPAASTPG